MAIDLEQAAARFLAEVLHSAGAAYWDRQSKVWKDAAPKDSDFNGNATEAELRDRWQRCMTIAKACAEHAELIRSGHAEDIPAEVWTVLGEVA